MLSRGCENYSSDSSDYYKNHWQQNWFPVLIINSFRGKIPTCPKFLKNSVVETVTVDILRIWLFSSSFNFALCISPFLVCNVHLEGQNTCTIKITVIHLIFLFSIKQSKQNMKIIIFSVLKLFNMLSALAHNLFKELIHLAHSQAFLSSFMGT